MLGQSELHLGDGLLLATGGAIDSGQREVGLRHIGIDFPRPLRMIFRLFKRCSIEVPFVDLPQSFAQSHVRVGKIFVETQGLTKVVGSRIRAVGIVDPVEKSLTGDVVIDGVANFFMSARKILSYLCGKLDRQKRREIVGHRSLEIEDLTARRRIGVRPQEQAGRSVGEIDGACELVPLSENLPVDHRTDAEFLPQLPRAAVAEIPRLRSPDHLETSRVAQSIDQPRRHGLGQAVELGVAGEVGKGHYGQCPQRSGWFRTHRSDKHRSDHQCSQCCERCKNPSRSLDRFPDLLLAIGHDNRRRPTAAAQVFAQLFEVVLQPAGRLVAVVWVFFKTPSNGSAEIVG